MGISSRCLTCFKHNDARRPLKLVRSHFDVCLEIYHIENPHTVLYSCCYTGYLFTFYNTKKTDERKAQIERCNDQVRLLYGPLLACVTATRSAYAAMVRQHAPDGQAESFMRAARECPEGPEGVAYRYVHKRILFFLVPRMSFAGFTVEDCGLSSALSFIRSFVCALSTVLHPGCQFRALQQQDSCISLFQCMFQMIMSGLEGDAGTGCAAFCNHSTKKLPT